MKRFWIVAVFMFAFGLGCMFATVVPKFVVPPVRAGTNPQKWEYMCVQDPDKEDIMNMANKAGAEGWELVAAALARHRGTAMWCFKRPLP